ncbi:ABC transporter permease [Bacillus testis]|uniref:ABC transporter permease n=1 Tax=Bacillus testis TaxID=1622072 RepID=UPI00067F242A|nr:ABC transporter permease [Bacillus testis]
MKRLFSLYGTVFVILLLLNFFLPRLMPGGPIQFIEGQDSGPMLTEAQKESMIAYYGLDQSLWEQFVHYVKGIVTFDFGTSFSHKTDVADLILEHFSYTISIVGLAVLLSFIIGITIGLVSAWFHGKRGDRYLMTAMLAIGSIPEFLLGIVLLLVFAVNAAIFPLSGASTPFMADAGVLAGLKDQVWHGFLPVLALTIVNISSVYLLVRNESIRVLASPYMEFAKMKGLNRRRLLYRHTAKNALLSVFTLLMIRIGLLFTGAIFIETLFSYPGIGKLLQEAILSRDYPLMHGLFFIFSSIILFVNMLADYVYPKLDPRIKGGNINEKHV